jgi:uncharacterized protein (DUF2141 family)
MTKPFSGHNCLYIIPGFILTILFLFSTFLLIRCARPGNPAGGPKDETPPEVVSEDPPNRTLNFNYTKATITFNEFILLKDPSKEIFISPPMKIRPEFKVAGKKIYMEFKEELKPNSTYTLNFGSSIIDFTESNPLVNYEYVFSTGNHIDSLSIPGKILNAFDHKPVESVVVMVYLDENDTIPLDSLPLRVPPKSASKTTKDGSFRINNLSAGEYKLFALEDLNNNFIFDLPNERIAFLDSLVSIEPEEPADTNIVASDTTLATDTTAFTDLKAVADSTAVAGLSSQILNEDTYTLFLFEETATIQKLLGKKLIGTSLLQYSYRLPVDSLKISPVGFQPGISEWYILEYGLMKDTVNIWLKTGLPDTIRICVNAGDSLVDTSRYVLSRQVSDRPGRRKETAPGGLGIFSNTAAGAFDLNKDLKLLFTKPIEDYDAGKLHLYALADTIIPAFSLSDTLKKHGVIEYQWHPEESYHVMIEDSAFCDISGSYNDSTSIKFKVRMVEDYGVLIMKLNLPASPGQFIIQLMSDNETIIQQKFISHSGSVKFEYLLPGNYKMKTIFDINSNGKWDTGNYHSYSLPERIEYYTPALSIRANWDLQEEWPLE